MIKPMLPAFVILCQSCVLASSGQREGRQQALCLSLVLNVNLSIALLVKSSIELFSYDEGSSVFYNSLWHRPCWMLLAMIKH